MNPKELAIPGTHDRVIEALSNVIDLNTHPTVLDVGAGEGALSKKLASLGAKVFGCDVDASMFDVEGIECREVDAAGGWPYADASFDLVVAVEVLEHIDGHEQFFREAARVLKPQGVIFFTTPNIASFKSRFRFLFTGTFYSYPPLVPGVKNPVRQHIAGFTVNRYEWMLSQHGLSLSHLRTDKWQKSSMAWAFLMPIARLVTRIRYGTAPWVCLMNATVPCFGRKLFIFARKVSDD